MRKSFRGLISVILLMPSIMMMGLWGRSYGTPDRWEKSAPDRRISLDSWEGEVGVQVWRRPKDSQVWQQANVCHDPFRNEHDLLGRLGFFWFSGLAPCTSSGHKPAQVAQLTVATVPFWSLVFVSFAGCLLFRTLLPETRRPVIQRIPDRLCRYCGCHIAAEETACPMCRKSALGSGLG